MLFSAARLEGTPLRVASFVLLVAALACAWIPYTQSAWWSFGFYRTQASFTPDFISGVFALLVVAPLYARGIVPYAHHSIVNIVFFVLNLALTATFVQIGLGKGSGLGTMPAFVAICCAIALSWLGMRAAAGFAWLGLLAFSIVSALLSNYDWGLAGFGFVACGFCGVLLQTPLSPNAMLAELVNEYAKKGAPPATQAQEHDERLTLTTAKA